MAQQTTVKFIDDLDGSDASGTFDFSLDGRNYQIDLSDENHHDRPLWPSDSST